MRSFVTRSVFGLCFIALVSGVMGTTPASAAGTSCLPASLKAKLSQIRAKFGPVQIVSTHRKGARIAGSGKRSYHASCRAVDFHPPKGKYGQVVSWLKANHSGGVGTYSCGMRHIHIDNGSKVRFHKCVNARGGRIGKKGKRRYAYKKRNKSYAGKGGKKRYASKKNYAGKKKKPVKVAKRSSGFWKMTAYAR